jgi:hypothetical protein
LSTARNLPMKRRPEPVLARFGAFLLIAVAASFHCPGAPRRVDDAAGAHAAVTPPSPSVRTPEPARVTDPPPKTVVVVVIDGARWQEVFDGTDPALAKIHALPRSTQLTGRELMPALHQLIDEGGAALGAPERGAPIVASGPAFVSVPGYIEILSGRPAVDCPNNRCRFAGERTLLDQIAAGSSRGPADVAVFASWSGLLRATVSGAPGVLVSAGRKAGQNLDPILDDREASQLFERGARADGYPGEDDYRPDRYTAELALDHLRRHRPRFLLLSLGDADAYGHANMYRRYLDALRESDRVVGSINRTLGELRAAGWPSTLFVTADHGRDRRCKDHGRRAPESARAFLIASGSGIVDHGYVTAPRARRLADIAPTVRVLLGLEADDHASAGTPLAELLAAPVDPRTAGLGT